MIAKELEQALNVVELTYSEIVEIANNIVDEYTKDIDPLISQVDNMVENLTNDDIRTLLLRLSIKAFRFGDVKERALIKADVAEIIKKEAYAKSFTAAEGSVAAKENATVLKIGNEIVSETVYTLVANLFKVKLEEIRRIIDTLKTILMSRLSEMKLSSAVNSEVEENQ